LIGIGYSKLDDVAAGVSAAVASAAPQWSSARTASKAATLDGLAFPWPEPKRSPGRLQRVVSIDQSAMRPAKKRDRDFRH